MKSFLKLAFGILMVGVLALLLGWGIYGLGKLYLMVIGKHAVLPQPEQAKVTGVEKQVLKLDKFDIYYVQLGIFSQKENAEVFAEKLQQQGVRAVVLKGGTFRIATGYFGQWAPASAYSALPKGVKPVVKSQTVNGLTFRVASAEAEDVKTILVNYAEILKGAGKTFDSVDQDKLRNLESFLEKTKQLHAETTDPVQRLQKRAPGSKPQLAALDKQGEQLEKDLRQFASSKNGENYALVQQSLLQLLNCYGEYLAVLQNKGGQA